MTSPTDNIRNFGFLMKDVYRLWVRHFEQRAAQLGMSLTQCKVLVFLSRHEGATQTKLAELCDTEPMTVVRVLDRMERDGWIERRADPSDRRANRLYRKPKSDQIVDEIQRIAERARNEALAGLSAAERDQMMNLLERIRGNLVGLLPSNDPSPTQVRDDKTASPSESTDKPRRARRSASRTIRTGRRKASS
jgi:MarR family transcriptional regulator, transcriptional regulator for hemolysin